MGQTLTNGIFLPNEGERNCYTGLAENWRAIDGYIGSYNVHVADAVIHVSQEDRDKWDAVDNKADASALTAHTGDTTIHVTAADKQTWNGKQDALSQTQLDAVNSGIDSSKVQQIATNTSDISSLQSGKANDNSVVHTSGSETISGSKTFSEDIVIGNSDTTQNSKRLVLRSYKTGLNSSNPDNWGISFNAGASYVVTINASKDSNGTQGLSYSVRTQDSNNNIFSSTYHFRVFTNGNSVLEPGTGSVISLGRSTNRWKDVQTNLVNGLTPSGLSLPGGTSVDISAYVTDLSGGSNQYVAPDNGIVAVDISSTNRYVLYNNNLSIGDRLTGSNFRRAAILQVRKNDLIIIQSDGGTLNYAKFYPCQGNI